MIGRIDSSSFFNLSAHLFEYLLVCVLYFYSFLINSCFFLFFFLLYVVVDYLVVRLGPAGDLSVRFCATGMN